MQAALCSWVFEFSEQWNFRTKSRSEAWVQPGNTFQNFNMSSLTWRKVKKKKISVDDFFVIFENAVSPSDQLSDLMNIYSVCCIHLSVGCISQFFSNFPISCFLCTPENINQTGVRLFWSRMMFICFELSFTLQVFFLYKKCERGTQLFTDKYEILLPWYLTGLLIFFILTSSHCFRNKIHDFSTKEHSRLLKSTNPNNNIGKSNPVTATNIEYHEEDTINLTWLLFGSKISVSHFKKTTWRLFK